MTDEKVDKNARAASRKSASEKRHNDTRKDARKDARKNESAAPATVREDNETILLALDQINQTIDVMGSIVGRLRNFVEAQDSSEDALLREDLRADRILH